MHSYDSSVANGYGTRNRLLYINYINCEESNKQLKFMSIYVNKKYAGQLLIVEQKEI